MIITHDEALADALRAGGDAGRRADRERYVRRREPATAAARGLAPPGGSRGATCHRAFRGLRLLLVCLFLGVGALAAIGTLTGAIERELDARGREILGGDIEVRGLAAPASARTSAALTRSAPSRRPADAGDGERRRGDARRSS